jgi:hypothetical protein
MLTNGGNTLIQAIACHAATISVPIAADQAGRITRCVDRGLAASLQDATRTAIDALDGLLPR